MRAARAVLRRPTLWVEAGAAASWAGLILVTAAAKGSDGASGSLWAQGPLWICQTGLHAAAGHGGGHEGGAPGVSAASLVAAAPMWALMAGAMMVPPALPSVHHVAVNSLYWRRRRAVAEFLLVFLAIWIAFGVFVLGAIDNWGATSSRWSLPAALLVAAAWQLTPFKVRALSACHRPHPLPPSGWRAMLGTARFGWRDGNACLTSCWAMMLAAVLAGPASLLWMGGVTAVVTAEKLALKPVRASRLVAALLAVSAVGVAAFAS